MKGHLVTLSGVLNDDSGGRCELATNGKVVGDEGGCGGCVLSVCDRVTRAEASIENVETLRRNVGDVMQVLLSSINAKESLCRCR